MGINPGNAQVQRAFYGDRLIRSVFEGERMIMGFITAAPPNSNIFTYDGDTVASNGTAALGFSHRDAWNWKLSMSIKSTVLCDDVTVNLYESGIGFYDAETGAQVFYIRYNSSSTSTNINHTIHLNGTEVYKRNGDNTVNTRIRLWYDFPSKTWRASYNGTTFYTSPQMEWRPMQLRPNLGYFYYPPYVIPGDPPILIDALMVGGWVNIYEMSRSIGYAAFI